MHFHTFRHSLAIYLVGSGLDLRRVQQLLGTGKKVKDPVLEGAKGLEDLPEALLKLAQRQLEIMTPIKTYDLRTFPVKVEGESILVDA